MAEHRKLKQHSERHKVANFKQVRRRRQTIEARTKDWQKAFENRPALLQAAESMRAYVLAYYRDKVPVLERHSQLLLDLFDAAQGALLEAADKYDDTHGTTLWQYAKSFSHGAMMEILNRTRKNLDPRNPEEKRLQAIEDRLKGLGAKVLSNPASKHDLAKLAAEWRDLGCTLEELGEIRYHLSLGKQRSYLKLRNIMPLRTNGETEQTNSPAPLLRLVENEERVRLKYLLEKLDSSKRRIVEEVAYEGRNLMDVAKTMNISGNLATQLYHQAISELRELYLQDLQQIG